jgi:hypothetical protein
MDKVGSGGGTRTPDTRIMILCSQPEVGILFNLFGDLLHDAQPSAQLSTARDRLVREATVTVVAIVLTFRGSGGGAAVHPAPAVRHRRRAARGSASGFRSTAARQVHR